MQSFVQFFTEAVNWKQPNKVKIDSYVYSLGGKIITLPAPNIKPKGKGYVVVDPKTFKVSPWPEVLGSGVWGSAWVAPDAQFIVVGDHGPGLNEIYGIDEFSFDSDFTSLEKLGWVRVAVVWKGRTIYAQNQFKITPAQKSALEYVAINNEFTLKFEIGRTDHPTVKIIYEPPNVENTETTIEAYDNYSARALEALRDWSKTYKIIHIGGPFFARFFNAQAHVVIEIKPWAEGIALSLIKTPPKYRKKGLANKALSEITKIADKHQVPITGIVSPQEDEDTGKVPMSSQQLQNWYTKHGFQPQQDMTNDYIIRHPKKLK